MKTFNYAVLLLIIIFSCDVNASFRLKNGKLISVGSSKSEIISLVGSPLSKDVEQIAIDNGTVDNPIKREILTYQLKGSIGGLYLVVITVENNKVVSISSKQENRI